MHEPKGVSTAPAGSHYESDGAGSGVWTPEAYGELYIQGGSGSITLPAASAFTRVDTAGTIWSAGESSGLTLNATTGEMTAINTGVYNIALWIVFSTAALAAGTRYYFRYAINGTTITRQLSTSKETAGVDTLDTAASGIAALTAGDVLSIHVGGDGTSSSTAIVVLEAGFSAHRV